MRFSRATPERTTDFGSYRLEEHRDGSLAVVHHRRRLATQISRWLSAHRSVNHYVNQHPFRTLAVAIGIVPVVGIVVGSVASVAAVPLEAIAWVTVLVAGLGVAFMRARREGAVRIDVPNRRVSVGQGARARTWRFTDLDGVHWWHNRWVEYPTEGETERYEVYLKVGGKRHVLATFQERRPAEMLCRRLDDAIDG